MENKTEGWTWKRKQFQEGRSSRGFPAGNMNPEYTNPALPQNIQVFTPNATRKVLVGISQLGIHNLNFDRGNSMQLQTPPLGIFLFLLMLDALACVVTNITPGIFGSSHSHTTHPEHLQPPLGNVFVRRKEQSSFVCRADGCAAEEFILLQRSLGVQGNISG